jgi:6-pyruvoyltetrahydropterin/6-carboxytetrahydropterin synthase
MFEISVRSRFSAAHHLRNHPGKCAAPHGHNWDVEVFLRGRRLDSSGMLVDFGELKQMLAKVLDRVDHRDLNGVDLLDGLDPTSENIAKVLYKAISKEFRARTYRVAKVCVHETPETTACYSEDAGG